MNDEGIQPGELVVQVSDDRTRLIISARDSSGELRKAEVGLA